MAMYIMYKSVLLLHKTLNAVLLADVSHAGHFNRTETVDGIDMKPVLAQ